MCMHDVYQKALEARVDLECKLGLVKNITMVTGKCTFQEPKFYMYHLCAH